MTPMNRTTCQSALNQSKTQEVPDAILSRGNFFLLKYFCYPLCKLSLPFTENSIRPFFLQLFFRSLMAGFTFLKSYAVDQIKLCFVIYTKIIDLFAYNLLTDILRFVRTCFYNVLSNKGKIQKLLRSKFMQVRVLDLLTSFRKLLANCTTNIFKPSCFPSQVYVHF